MYANDAMAKLLSEIRSLRHNIIQTRDDLIGSSPTKSGLTESISANAPGYYYELMASIDEATTCVVETNEMILSIRAVLGFSESLKSGSVPSDLGRLR